ncbi:MAG: FtsX-like permease family protein, partial [Abitibacteriaceae bacterium]|nr:FtsX-like permease family protein [Abditibacteriaceae bacterium]
TPSASIAAPSAPATSPAPQTKISIPAGADAAMIGRLQADVRALTQFKSRVPGTPGNRQAADYVAQRFQQIGLQKLPKDTDYYEEYEVTAPVTKSAQLTINGRALPILPIYPNHVVTSSTPREGLTGPMIYAGQGNPSDYNGFKMEGAIVVLDFNSGLNWITAADLGARAVIFLEPQTTTRSQAERKFANLPLEVPRFYAPRATANTILTALGLPPVTTAPTPLDLTAPTIALPDIKNQKPTTGTLQSQVIWERVKTRNIVGMLPGTGAAAGGSDKDKKPNTIVIDGYYDSMALTPDLAPGAEAAGNCAALLEVARYFKAHPTPYNLLFVANGAHHIALAGTRNFLAKHFFDADGKGGDELKKEIDSYRAFIGLDLTSATNTVGLFGKSNFYNQMGVGSENILLNQFADFTKAINDFAKAEGDRRGLLEEQSEAFYVDGITGRNGRTWRSYLPSLLALDSEAATMAQKPGISFATANDARMLQDTPFDTPERLTPANFSNLAQQINTVDLLLGQALTPGAADPQQADKTAIDRLPESSTLSQNFGYGVGRAIYRQAQKIRSFLPNDPIPDSNNADSVSILPPDQRDNVAAVGYVLDRDNFYKSYSGVRGAFIERALFSNGNADAPPAAQFLFLGPRVGDTKGGGTPDLEIEAYSVSSSGRILFAPDMGAERQRFSPKFKKTAALSYKDEKLKQLNVDATVICFQGRSTALYDTLDQRYFTVLREMAVLDGTTDAEPVQYGFLRPSAPGGSSDIEPTSIVFSKPGDRFKLIMSAGLLGKRLILLDTTPGAALANGKTVLPEGSGFVVPDDPNSNSIIRVAYQAARDLWTLDQERIFLLKRFGINNERVDTLHGQAGGEGKDPSDPAGRKYLDVTTPTGGAIAEAEKSLANLQYDKFYMQARRAFGLESRAYPDVENTAQDVLKGIVFYLALLLPFSYFVERLLLGAPDIRKQIFGTSLTFLIVFFCIRWVHPAFELAMTPFIILLAFIILALTVFVTSFLSGKFEAEIKRLKQGVHFADVGRLSAIGAALGLGIANMRRRPVRTALTCVTLVLLTFTVLSFTSVSANISNFARPYGNSVPPYQGLLVRQPDWGALPEVAVNSLRNDFTQTFDAVALRSWYLSRDQGEPLQLRVNNVADPNKFFYAPAVLGVTPDEVKIHSPIVNTLIRGKWFDGTRKDVCLLPRAMLLADKTTPDTTGTTETKTDKKPSGPPLGLTEDNAVGAKVQIAGQVLEVIGVFDDEKWFPPADARKQGAKPLHDLDDEEFTPVDYQNEQNKQTKQTTDLAGAKGESAQVQRYQHMDANALLLMPYETVLEMGGTTRSVAAGFSDPTKGLDALNRLMNRAALGIFGATPAMVDGKPTGPLEARLYSSVESTSYEGFASLLIPVLIAALIIANTMLGSVFERTREIGIYSSVGLAPIHVAALFIAEAMVYAVLGSISGYLIAQIVAKVITTWSLLPGITLNYSSSAAVISTIIVMATVLLSTIYPAWQASRMSQPDIERRWRMSEPTGDIWRFQFPFTVSGQQPLGVAQFLADFFETHTDTSVGRFYTDRVFFTALPLRDAVAILNSGSDADLAIADGTPAPSGTPATEHSAAAGPNSFGAATTANGTTAATNGTANGANGTAVGSADPSSEHEVVVSAGGVEAPLSLANIAADEDTEVYRLAMRVWLAPFDMGVSQDTDILLVPSAEPGLYELQLKLVRQSGEIAAWKRVNRGFMSDLRKQLLLWRTIKREGQQEYVLRGRAHVSGQVIPTEVPGAVVGTVSMT